MRRLFSGKHRIPRVVNTATKRILLRQLALEEENLFYLRQPYLSQEQEQGHTSALNKRRERIAQIRAQKIEMKMLKHVSFDDRLQHLKVAESWE